MRLVRKAEYEAVYHYGNAVRRGDGEVANRNGGEPGGTIERAANRVAGGRLRSPQFVVFYCANGVGRSRFGISVKKALGGAVVRNRIRRRIREILRRNYLEIPSGWDMVMHPRRSVAGSEFASLQAELIGLLRTIPPSAAQPTSLGATR
jgi:ribonuclease P protein component